MPAGTRASAGQARENMEAAGCVHSIPFHSIPFHSIPFLPFHSIPFPFHYFQQTMARWSCGCHATMAVCCRCPTVGVGDMWPDSGGEDQRIVRWFSCDRRAAHCGATAFVLMYREDQWFDPPNGLAHMKSIEALGGVAVALAPVGGVNGSTTDRVAAEAG